MVDSIVSLTSEDEMSHHNTGILTGEDGKQRCFWAGDKDDYLHYHDYEWGYPVDDDYKLFEKICLEGFQAGLSWLTILRKRDNFRDAFSGFDFHKVAKYDSEKVEQLVQNAGIVRHRGKIESTINNARCALEIVEEFGSLSQYFWQFEPNPVSRPKEITYDLLRTQLTKSGESAALSKDLKKRSWSFVGPTTVYAFMQAMGMVNDHISGCVFRAKVQAARREFKRS